MARYSLLALCVVFTSAAANQASAQQACGPQQSWGQKFHYDYYRSKHWPMPFRAADTSAVLSYFDVQRNNGWKLNNTVGVAMFDPNTQMLTESGEAHVQWIVSRAPQNRRAVFVLQGHDQQATAQRVESTQLAISKYVPVGPLPEIYLTSEDAPGSSGVYQTAIARALTNSVPPPRLPAPVAAGL